jgi:hypothetical protein
MPKYTPMLAALLAVSTFAFGAPGDGRDDLVGNAYDRDGRLRYREYHGYSAVPPAMVQQTVYRDPAGTEIGRMEADYRVDRYAPAYRMLDFRHDTEEVVRRDGDAVYLEHRVGAKRRSKTLRVTPGRQLVIGPGFNELIRAKWHTLLAGEPLLCEFAIPNRLQLVAVRIRHVPSGDPDAGHRFSVTAENLLIRLIASELNVEYDRATRALVAYEGPSNVNDDRNRQQNVLIRFAAGAGVVARHAPRR